MDLSIVIVSYNTRELLMQCLDFVFRNSPSRSFEVIVVDNHSKDGSPEIIKKKYLSVKLLENLENRGYAGANNQGVQIAKGKYILLLNSDTRVLPKAFDRLMNSLDEDSETGIVGAQLLNPDLTIQGSAKSFPSPVNILFGRKSIMSRLFPNNPLTRKYLPCLNENLVEPFEVDHVAGAGLMIRKDLVDKIGLFDERFFMYWEDTDLCYRAKAAGWKVICHPQAKIIHDEAGSSKKHPFRMILHFNNSVYHLYTKHYVKAVYNPLRLIAFIVLFARAAILIMLLYFAFNYKKVTNKMTAKKNRPGAR
jgi:GT2 family glycosyltransferase